MNRIATCPCGETFRNFLGLALHGRRCDKVTHEVRFWAKVDKSPRPDGCWIWRGARSLSNYGTCSWYGTNINAHRGAWMLTHGSIAPGLDVLHRCNNGHIGCVRPDHLYLGTDLENFRDRIAAGKPFDAKDRRLLPPEKVRAIRSLKGKASSSEVAKQFGMSYRAVAKIWARHVYKSVV